MKRQLNRIDSENELRKSFHASLDNQEFLNTKSPSCLEDLSNDILLEIFDYFYACKLYKAFENLNYRFHTLLNSSFYGLKINDNCCVPRSCDYCTKIIVSNKPRIISLDLKALTTDERLFKSITFDQLFCRLESFHLNIDKKEHLLTVLTGLPLLPRLISLAIRISFVSFNQKLLFKMYEVIFSLPTVKSLEISYRSIDHYPSSPSNIIDRHNMIRYMTLNQRHTIYELITILSYTPQLRHLVFRDHLINSSGNILTSTAVPLPKLRSIFMNNIALKFNEFESFLLKICSQLRILRISTHLHDPTYLDANRWEQLISQHMPYLHTFSLTHYEGPNIDLQKAQNRKFIAPFTSSFWTKRKWNLKLTTGQRYYTDGMIYEICPKKKSWYNLPENIKNHRYFHQNIQFDQMQEIFYSDAPIVELNVYIGNVTFWYCHSLLQCVNVDHITIVNILGVSISCEEFFNLINYLPMLNALNVPFIDFVYLTLSLPEAKKNNITKVKVMRMIGFKEAQFFLRLCPMIEYLEINEVPNRDYHLFVRYILTQNTINVPHLHTLGISLEKNVEETIKDLDEMMTIEKLTKEYVMRYIDGTIYIQWE